MDDIRKEKTKQAIKRDIEDAFRVRRGIEVTADADFRVESGNLEVFVKFGEREFMTTIDRRYVVLHPGEDPAPIDLFGWKQLWEDSRRWGEFRNGTIQNAISEFLHVIAPANGYKQSQLKEMPGLRDIDHATIEIDGDEYVIEGLSFGRYDVWVQGRSVDGRVIERSMSLHYPVQVMPLEK